MNSEIKTHTADLSFSETIDRLLVAEATLKNLPGSEPVPEQQPAYKIAAWNEYAEKLSAATKANQARLWKLGELNKEIANLRQTMLSALPVAHVWFITDDDRYAFAKQCSNWPMDPPVLEIVQFPVIENLPKLKMQIVPDN